MTPAATNRSDPPGSPGVHGSPDPAQTGGAQTDGGQTGGAQPDESDRSEETGQPAGQTMPGSDSQGPLYTSALLDLPEPRWWTRNPLRVRLVAAVLALMALAMIVISVASTVFVNRYLVDRADTQLSEFARRVNDLAVQQMVAGESQQYVILVPSDFFAMMQRGDGSWRLFYDDKQLTADDLPSVTVNDAFVEQHLDEPFTINAKDGKYRWRTLVTTVGGKNLVVAQNLSTADNVVERLVVVEVLFGVSVLILLALVGAWVVRQSLRPLAAIERTAAAIARGDLTQRVPELDPRTELGQLSAALNTMLTQIELGFRARQESEARAVGSEERMRQFVADASHELRTPLTSIRGFAELYRQGAAPDPSEVLRRIEDEAARMGLLVEDLLLLARLDKERPLLLAPVPLAHLISDAAAAAHAIAPERTIEVDVARPTDRLVVNGDEARLRQVIDNLVTNALTHTPAGTPITLRLRADGDQHGVIEVMDGGSGLTPEQAVRVFERFYRVDKARARRAAGSVPAHTGTGLGLAIVAALVAAHDGTVEVDSRPGQGATFRVRLPLVPAPAADED